MAHCNTRRKHVGETYNIRMVCQPNGTQLHLYAHALKHQVLIFSDKVLEMRGMLANGLPM